MHQYAGVMELADVVDSKSTGSDTVPVRGRPPAPKPQVRQVLGACLFGYLLFAHASNSTSTKNGTYIKI